MNVAQALRQRLRGVRLDTPPERGGVTVDLVKEVRARLDMAGFRHVEIFVSGGFSPDRIREFTEAEAPVDTFSVGSYISNASPNDFTADIHEVDGEPAAWDGTPCLLTNVHIVADLRVDKCPHGGGPTVDKCQQTDRRPGGNVTCSATFTRLYSYR